MHNREAEIAYWYGCLYLYWYLHVHV